MQTFQIYRSLVVLFLFGFIMLSTQQAFTQALVNNNGAQVTVKDSAFVIVKTNSINNMDGTIDNEGTIKVEEDIINNDTMTGGNTTGVYDLDGNWENNATFIPDSTTVFFKGANQLITGTSVTEFFNLDLQGTGTKTQTLNSVTQNNLTLNDRELTTDSFTMLVTNTDTGAIDRTTGYVSSLDTGRLAWRTNSTDPYLFPVGSNVGTQRYRPVELTPTSSAQNTYGVRMANVDATTEGYNRTITGPNICDVNPNYYHRIYQQSSTNNSDIKLFFDQAADGSWSNMGHWQNTPRWEDMGNATSGTQSGFSTLSISNWSNFNYSPFAFTNPKVTIDSFDVTPISCFGASNGAIDLHVSGGLPPVDYNWSNNDTTQDISGLSPGNYSVTVSDSTGCGDTLSVTIQQPDTLVVTDSVVNVSCAGANDGDIHLSVNGGTNPYDYNWDNNDTTQSITGLAGGTYNVTVTDSNGCTATSAMTVQEPDSLSIQTSVTNASCNGATDGSAGISVTGGTTPYDYNWSTGSDSSSADSLSAGTYTVTVTDANGCTNSASVAVGEPQPISISPNVNDVSCNGGEDGSITLNVSGGSGAYSYVWSNGKISASIDTLSAGTYSVTVTDDNGCSDSTQATVSEPDSLILSTVVTDVSCNDGDDGLINLSVAGGTPPYNYNWSNGQTSQNDTNLTAGTYDLTVTDGNNCTKTSSYEVTQPAALSLTVDSNNVLCNGAADGNAEAQASGGVGGFQYIWSNAQSGSSIDNLSPGTYSVTVTDTNNCTIIDSTVITEPSPLTAEAGNDTTIARGYTAPLNVNASGGTGSNYQYEWLPASSLSEPAIANPYATPQTSTNYVVTVTDDNGCQVKDSVTVEVDVKLYNHPDAFSPNGDGQNDKFFVISSPTVEVESFKIFNRWGQLLHDKTESWNGIYQGEDQPTDTYVYQTKIKLPDGSTETESGEFILVR
ncbi:MAG: hypothetical protein BRD50_03770 [Bacteroidetes bacterium SW_11_45_7]|nr:MAG: hypothetical protein BRD50_03770 [Bacteroidetes bacterium SW_11_45_7]